MQLPKFKFEYQRGQALLIILLVFAVVLTVTLSAVSTSTTDIKISSNEEQSSRAFNAAEAGIERSLITGLSIGPTTLSNNSKLTTNVTYPTYSDNRFLYPTKLKAGEKAVFWMVSHDSTGQLTCLTGPCVRANYMDVCWGSQGTPNNNAQTPALELTFFYDPFNRSIASPNNFSTVWVKKAIFDPWNGRLGPNNNFTKTGITTCPANFVGGTTLQFQVASFDLSQGSTFISCYNITGCLVKIEARMLYNTTTPQPVAIHMVNNNANGLPAQGILYSSTGSYGDIQRKVNVFQSYPQAPSIFDYTVFSQGGLVK